MEVGNAVRTLREASGLTLKDAAAAAGVSESYLSRVETGMAEASPAWVGNVSAAIAEHLRKTASAKSKASRAAA